MPSNYVLDMQVVRATAAAREELADESAQYRVQLGADTASPDE